ncbi:hypothetical protein VCHENC02_5623B, partial [Vibrio harveyi]
QLHGSLHMS